MALALAPLLLAGCASGREDPQVAYKEAESVDPLVVPPDLVKPGAPGALSVPDGAGDGEAAARLLPEFEGMRFVRAGSSVWLELDDTAPEAVWPRLGSFLQAQGLEIAQASPALGIVETEWAERYDGPPRGGLTGMFDSLFGRNAEPVLDRYQFSVERIPDGGTRIVLAQRSVREVAREAERVNAVATAGSPRSFDWKRSEGDPAVQTEMMKRLLVHLGVSAGHADGVIAAGVGAAAVGAPGQYFESQWGRAWIEVDDRNLRRVYARVEHALTAIGAEIGAADFDARRFELRWAPSPAGEAEEAHEALTVYVRREDGATHVTAGDAGGQRSGDAQKALLRELTTALGGDPGDVQRPAEPTQESDREPGRPRSIMSPRRDD